MFDFRSKQHHYHTPVKAFVWVFRCLSVLLLTVLACNDPYSQNRIARREAHLKQFDNDVRGAEQVRARRLKEAGETIHRWWAQDREQFDRKWPTVGDYIW